MAQYDALTKQYRGEQEWLNHRVALICAVIANVNRDPKKHKAFQPDDFMPKQQEHKGDLTSNELYQRIISANAAFGGEVKE